MKKTLLAMVLALPLFAVQEHLTLEQALTLVKQNNLEIKVAQDDVRMKELDIDVAKGYNYGSLDLVINALRSNDAGNVFGFKLQSREATFRDFGFSEFLGGVGWALQNAGGDFVNFTNIMSDPAMQDQLLNTAPTDLNYPEARNHFQEKIQYQVPLYVGGKLNKYGQIAQKMAEMSRLDKQKVVNEKVFQTRKTFYDIALVNSYIKNLKIILNNVEELEDTVTNMVKEGYALDIDLLQVKSKKADVLRMLNQAKLNRDLAYQFLSFLVDDKVESVAIADKDVPMPIMSKEEMLNRNIDIQKAKMGLKITDLALGVERASFYPQIGAFAEYGSADDQFMNDFSDKDAYTVGVQLKWNIFNGLIDKSKYEKARVQNLKVRHQVELAKKGIALKIDKIITEIKSKEYDIKSLQEKVKLARRVYENYYNRYKEGLISINDVLIKNSEEIQAVLKLAETRNARNDKVFELENIINKGML
ncbi:TolC family protein [Hydrogenimonas thermophila]|uniref:TolC family protein n=1 Tax=Hydrogenimonas thermophila TaxID=223786 RepID=UPI002936D54E|nr:TolC family protein [Hydrogenimonas thermophila]WOE69326.1 TolC family protein [Hydrogenimonas thermophila]WOE71836.1 TolC family protein [Hydrogenimonas thermophila]